MEVAPHELPFEGRAVVLTRRAEADMVVSLELGLPAGEELPAWEPGAHIDLLMPNGLIRQYSLCGPVDNRKSWRIGVLHEPEGRGGSRYIHDVLDEGSEVDLRGPRNHFALVDAPRYVFIAGGIGITPLLPMIAQAQAAGADWTLHYGGRARATMAFRDELEPYGDRVHVYPKDEGKRADVDAILSTPRDGILVYCCGPPRMIDAVERRCQAWPAGTLRVEHFVADPQTGDGLKQPIEVELRASGITLEVPPEVTVLDAVENAGIHVVKSCEEGICGSCETAVLEGEVDHRDSVLTEEERAAMDTMMICVSRAKCGRLVLDL